MAVAKTPLDILPGVVRVGSPYSLSGRWVDSQYVRFVKNYPQKIGGWTHLIREPLTGICRSLTPHNSPSPTSAFPKHAIAAGTHHRLYFFTYDGDFTNITPIRLSATPANAISTTNGSSTVTITHSSHGLQVGEIIEVAAPITVGGITLHGEYTVTAVPTANTYRIDAGANATSTVSTTGSPQLVYYIAPGGSEIEETPDPFGYPPRVWWCESYGKILLAMPTNGTLYQFDPDADTSAQAVANAPTAEAMFLTDERFPVMLAADGVPMKIMWPDQDDITVWTPSALNTANERILKEGTRIMAGAVLGPRLGLIWTDLATYLMQYTGDNAVYATNVLAPNSGLIGPKAWAVNDGVAYWMSPHGFHMSTGGQVQDIPNQQDILRYVMETCCPTRNLKAACLYNPTFNEVSWFLVPAGGATEPSLQVTVNLDSFVWWTDTMARTAWMFDAYHQAPDVIAASAAGRLYRHETGLDATDALPLDSGALAQGMLLDAIAATFDLEGDGSTTEFDIGMAVDNIARILWFEDGIPQVPGQNILNFGGQIVERSTAPVSGANILGLKLASTPAVFTFVGTGSGTTADLGVTISDQGRVLWFEDGIWQHPGDDFTVSGSVVTRTTAPANGAAILVYLLGTAADEFDFLGDGTTLAFDLGLGTIPAPEQVLWFVDGIYQHPTSNFSVSGTSLLPGSTEPLTAYVKSAPFDLASGNALVDIFGYVPDLERIEGPLSINIETYDYPNESAALESVSETFHAGQGIVDLHVSGRQVAVTLTSAASRGDFRLGRHRLELGPAGLRR